MSGLSIDYLALRSLPILFWGKGRHIVNISLDNGGEIRNRPADLMDIQIIRQPVTRQALHEIAGQQIGDTVKAVVDVERRVMAVGGELHSDEESVLLDQGSRQNNLWRINLYLDQPHPNWIAFDSMINVRPSQGNRSRSVERPDLRETIIAIVHQLVEGATA